MASFQVGDDDEPISGINITPLVDVVLVLLVIFIVTASFLLKSAIPLELPSAASADQRAPSILAVSVNRRGDLFINGKAGKLAQLAAVVKQAAAAKGGNLSAVEAFVSADRGAQYGVLVEVMDRLRLLGVTSIALDTRPEVAAR